MTAEASTKMCSKFFWKDAKKLGHIWYIRFYGD